MKNTNIKSTLPILLGLVLLAAPAAVQGQSYNGFYYSINYPSINTVTITGYYGPGGAGAIPSTISNLTVTIIGYAAVAHNNNLTIVMIPSSVTNIGYAAFDTCIN